MYNSSNFKNALHFVDKYKGKVGLEIFPRFDEPEFENVLKECVPILKKVPISFHEPAFEIEHTADYDTTEYRRTMHRCRKHKNTKSKKIPNARKSSYHKGRIRK